MTATYPKVQAFKKDNPIQIRPGIAGKVALIGSFNSEETAPVYYSDLDLAYKELGSDTTFNGVAVLEDLFVGASGILAVNTTTWTGTGNEKTPDKSITTAKLTDALAKIKHEKFDCIFIADLLTDAFLPIITDFLDERQLNKIPAGFGGACSRTTLQEYTATSELLGEHCYGVVTQQFKVKNNLLSLLKYVAYWTGVVAGLNVGNSMTKKIMPGVNGLEPEYNFEVSENGFTGLDLLQLGFMTFECLDRENNIYCCVNSEQPNGYDLYINRVRDYVLREMALITFLGYRNRALTLGQVEQELDRVRDVCVNTLDLLEGIDYHIVKAGANCVDVYVDRLLFAGVITEINVYFTVEVI